MSEGLPPEFHVTIASSAQVYHAVHPPSTGITCPVTSMNASAFFAMPAKVVGTSAVELATPRLVKKLGRH